MQLWHVQEAPLTGAVLSAYRDLIDDFGGSDGPHGPHGPAPHGGIDRAINAIAPIDRFYVSERKDLTQSPRLIAYRVENVLADGVADYMDRYFRRDPVAKAVEAAIDDGATVVLRVGPEDITESEYRDRFFDRPAIVERLSFVQRRSSRWLIMNVARRAPLPRFSEEEVGSLASLSQLLLPLAVRQAELEPARGRADVLSVEVIEHRFAERFPALSGRERQVCARTVIGMTSEATALDLGVGIGSVQTYRKRAFQRLEICSAIQLAHLIMH